MVQGTFVSKFAAASHGLVVGISLDAQWEYAIMPIVWIDGNRLQFLDYPKMSIIHTNAEGEEFTFIHNQCPMDRAFKRPPAIHKVYPFKDENTEAGEAAKETTGE